MTRLYFDSVRKYGDSGAHMIVCDLSAEDRAELVHALENVNHECLVGYDPIDQALKVKVDGGTWSPPIGKEL